MKLTVTYFECDFCKSCVKTEKLPEGWCEKTVKEVCHHSQELLRKRLHCCSNSVCKDGFDNW